MLHGLPGNPTSSLPGGLASSPCCLALDSSSSFPCPAFLAIAKSVEEGLEFRLRLVRLELAVFPSLWECQKLFPVLLSGSFPGFNGNSFLMYQ
ncbi:hypothetical protein STEG23_033940 [Scotinomys teguina]